MYMYVDPIIIHISWSRRYPTQGIHTKSKRLWSFAKLFFTDRERCLSILAEYWTTAYAKQKVRIWAHKNGRLCNAYAPAQIPHYSHIPEVRGNSTWDVPTRFPKKDARVPKIQKNSDLLSYDKEGKIM